MASATSQGCSITLKQKGPNLQSGCRISHEKGETLKASLRSEGGCSVLSRLYLAARRLDAGAWSAVWLISFITRSEPGRLPKAWVGLEWR